MTKEELFDVTLNSYKRYYNLNTEDVLPPFSAQATFQSHNEQYMLIKAAKIAEMDANEYVYFYLTETISEEEMLHLIQVAWEDGLSKVVPSSSHRNSDVTVFIVADSIPENVRKRMRKVRLNKSYALGLKGYSNFRLVALESSSGKAMFNPQGDSMKKLVRNILKEGKGEKT